MQTVRNGVNGWKIFENILWYGFVFTLPFQTVWIAREVFFGGEKWQYGTIGIYVSEIFLALWIGVVFLRRGLFLLGNNTKWHAAFLTGSDAFFLKLRRNFFSLRLFFSAFFLWIALSFFWSIDPILSLSYAGVVLLGILLVWGMKRSKIDVQKTMIVFVSAIGMQAVLGILQFVLQDGFAMRLLGMSAHDAWEAGTSVLKLTSGRWLRAYGGMPHPNVLGGCLAVGMLFAFGGWMQARRAGVRYAYAVYFVTIFLALLCTFSRTAWGGALLGGSALFVWILLRKKVLKQMIPIMGMIFLALVVFVSILSSCIFSRFDEGTITREGSIKDRVTLAREAISVSREHLFFGSGAGTETLAVMRGEIGNALKNESEESNSPVSVWKYQPAHTVFLLILAETGIVGLFLFGGMVVLLAGRMVHVFRGENGHAVLAACSIFALFPFLFLDHWLWTTHFGILLTAFLFGMAVYGKKLERLKF